MLPVSAESIESSFFALALAVLVVAVVAFVAVAFSLSIGGARARARARCVLFGRAGEEGKDTKRARLCQLLCNSKQPTPK